MSFVLRIYFIGLMAFVPNHDETGLTVLLVDARKGYFASDGSEIEKHVPLLLARSGACSGDCRGQQKDLADLLFQRGRRKQSGEAAESQLLTALQGGGGWILDSSELSIAAGSDDMRKRMPSLRFDRRNRVAAHRLPESPEEKEDFSWTASMDQIASGGAQVDPDVLSPRPEKGLIVGRWTLDQGEVKTLRMVGVGGKVVPLGFKSLRGGPRVVYEQALADWIVAEVEIPGCEVELIERNFLTDARRSMKLEPAECGGGLVEVVLFNIPESTFRGPARRPGDAPPHAGTHFEMFYELLDRRPPNHLRPVPFVPTHEGTDWALLNNPGLKRASFLQALGLTDPRGPVDRVICPPAQLLAPLELPSD